MGKLEKFEIELDNLDGVYYPGQSMTGSIVVELSDSMKMRCKMISFCTTINYVLEHCFLKLKFANSYCESTVVTIVLL